MNGNGHGILTRLRTSDPTLLPRLSLSEAASELGNALRLKHEAATMTLYGLCATGNIRSLSAEGQVIEEGECTIGNFNPAFVIASDLQSFLTDWSPDPQPQHRDAVIAEMLKDGLVPGASIPWKEFENKVRNACNGWIGSRPARGFDHKTIYRTVKRLRNE